MARNVLDRLLGRPGPQIAPQDMALTASAAVLDVGRPGEIQRALSRRQGWQTQAWAAYKAVGEVKYATFYVGNSMSKLRLFAAERMSPDDPPTPTENVDVIQCLERIRNPVAGYSKMLRSLGINLTVPGECYLIGTTNTDGEEDWNIRSISEVVSSRYDRAKLMVLEGPNDQDGRVLTPDDYIARLWIPDPEWGNLADSALSGVLDIVEELILLGRAARATVKSRIGANGVIKWPAGLQASSGTLDPTQAPGSGGAKVDPILQDFMDAMITPIKNEASAAAVVPLIVKGAPDLLKELQHMTLDRPFDQQLESRTGSAIRRLAQGLNVPVQVILGMEDVNHWSSWQIEDSAFTAHIEPTTVQAVEGLTVGYLHTALKAMGVPDYRKYCIWYDPVDLIIRPNRADETRDAFDRYAVDYHTYRKSIGLPDTAHPSFDEITQRIEIEQAKRVSTRQNLPEGAPITAEPSGNNPAPDPGGKAGPPPTPAEPGATGHAPVRAVAAAAFNATVQQEDTDRFVWTDDDVTIEFPPQPPDPARHIGPRLAAIDRDLRARLTGAADTSMRRALDRAGAQLRTKSRSNKGLALQIQDVSNGRVAMTLGATGVRALGVREQDLLESSFDSFGEQFLAWTRSAMERALALVPHLDDAERADHLEETQSLRDEAWVWLRDALMAQAQQRLYQPEVPTPEVGEFDPTMTVQPGILREAMAQAGGREVITAAYSTAHSSKSRGVANSPTVQRLLADGAISTAGYTWEWNGSPIAFEPHYDLGAEGVEFLTWDDPALENTFGWPFDVDFFEPGDHEGCNCDAIAMMVTDPAAVAIDERDVPQLTTTDIANLRKKLGKDEFRRPFTDPAARENVLRGEPFDRSTYDMNYATYEDHAVVEFQNNGYRGINGYLRSEPPTVPQVGLVKQYTNKEVNLFINDLDRATRLNSLADDVSVYRGSAFKQFVGKDPSALIGTVIKDKGFVSTTFDREAAQNYAAKLMGKEAEGRTLARIDLPAGTEGRAVMGTNDEFLLRRNQVFRVKEAAVDPLTGDYNVVLELLRGDDATIALREARDAEKLAIREAKAAAKAAVQAEKEARAAAEAARIEKEAKIAEKARKAAVKAQKIAEQARIAEEKQAAAEAKAAKAAADQAAKEAAAQVKADQKAAADAQAASRARLTKAQEKTAARIGKQVEVDPGGRAEALQFDDTGFTRESNEKITFQNDDIGTILKAPYDGPRGWSDDEWWQTHANAGHNVNLDTLEGAQGATQHWQSDMYPNLQGLARTGQRVIGRTASTSVDTLRGVSNALDKAVTMNTITREGTVVFRGGAIAEWEGKTAQEIIGSTISDSGWTATSSWARTAMHFTENALGDERAESAFFARIDLPVGTEGRAISAGESEFLMPRGTTFRVVGAYDGPLPESLAGYGPSGRGILASDTVKYVVLEPVPVSEAEAIGARAKLMFPNLMETPVEGVPEVAFDISQKTATLFQKAVDKGFSQLGSKDTYDIDTWAKGGILPPETMHTTITYSQKQWDYITDEAAQGMGYTDAEIKKGMDKMLHEGDLLPVDQPITWAKDQRFAKVQQAGKDKEVAVTVRLHQQTGRRFNQELQGRYIADLMDPASGQVVLTPSGDWNVIKVKRAANGSWDMWVDQGDVGL